MAGFREPAPIKPFLDWCERRLLQLEQQVDVDGSLRALVSELGWDPEAGVRRLFRYRKESLTGQVERADLEDALHHAGIGWWEVYDDDPVEVRHADCAACGETTPADADGHCLWCGPPPEKGLLPREPFVFWLQSLRNEYGSWVAVGARLGVTHHQAQAYIAARRGARGIQPDVAERWAAAAGTSVDVVYGRAARPDSRQAVLLRQITIAEEATRFCPRCAVDRAGLECLTCGTPLVRPVVAEPPKPVRAVPPATMRRTLPKVAPASRPGVRGWEPTPAPDLMAALKPTTKPEKRKGPLTEPQIREAAREFLDADLNMAETARRMLGRTHHTNLTTLQGQLRIVWERRGWNLRRVRGAGDPQRAAVRAKVEAYLAAPAPRDTGMTYSGSIPAAIVWEAAWLYYYEGLGFKRAADRLWPIVRGRRLAVSPNALLNNLYSIFERNGWPRRDRIEATRAASFRHGLKARDISHEDDVRYRRWLKRQTTPSRPRCAGETDGRRCRSKAMKGSRYCFAHDPASSAKRMEILSRRRQARDRNMLPAEPFALWLTGRVDELGSYKAVAAATTLSQTKVSELVERKRGKATVMRRTVVRALAAAGGSTRLEDLYAIADVRESEAIAA